MINYYNHIDGQTSTFIPGERGNDGKRARVTFVASYNEGEASEEFLIKQYYINNNSIEKPINLSYFYNKQSILSTDPKWNDSNTHKSKDGSVYPDFNANDDGYSNNPSVPANSYIDENNNNTYGVDENGNILPTSILYTYGDIVKREALQSDSMEDNVYTGYKFYQTNEVQIDDITGYIAKMRNSYIAINIPEFNYTPKIIKKIPENPEPYDYIMYIDKIATYILQIISVSQTSLYEPIVCSCKILDKWKKSEETTALNDIVDNIKLYCTDITSNHVKLDDTQTIGEQPNIKHIKEKNRLKNFLLISNSAKIDNYKITLEFSHKTDYPIFSSVIAEKFDTDTPTNNTIIGCKEKYDRSSNYKINFDNERLGTYEIIIKDFNESKGDSTYTSTVKIKSLSEEKDYEDYIVYLYVYYKKINGGYNKTLISRMSYYDLILMDDLLKPNLHDFHFADFNEDYS